MMPAKLVSAAGLAITLLAPTGPGAPRAIPETTPAAITAPRPPTVRQGEVVIPGGRRFINAAAGLLPTSGDAAGEDFLADLARVLSSPGALDYRKRVREMVEELRSLEEFMTGLEERYPSVIPSLSERGSVAYTKGAELLDFLGFRIVDDTGSVRLLRQAGDRQERRRQMLGYLGVSTPVLSRLWATGNPIVLNIADESAPLLFDIASWNAEVFEESLSGDALFHALVGDRDALGILAGYAALDRATRDWLFDEVSLRALHRGGETARGFLELAPYLRVEDGALLLPGGDRDAWEAIVGPWTDTAELISTVATKDDGLAAHLWRSLALLPDERAAYLLTLDRVTAAQRKAWAEELYGAIRPPDFGRSIRWPEDAAELFVNLSMLPENAGIAWPGGARAWLAAIEGDDLLETEIELDTLLERFADAAEHGPDVDALLLRGLLRGSERRRGEPTAIRKYLAISRAIRYQPATSMRRAIPLLYRNYRRFGRSYGFFVMPTPLPEGMVERLIRRLQRIDTIEHDEVRLDTARLVQATMVLLHEILRNDLLTDDDRAAVLSGFTRPPAADATQRGGATDHDDAIAIAEFWRSELVPAMERALRANDAPGDPQDVRRTVVTALVGNVGAAEIQVQGIDFDFLPAEARSRRILAHLAAQGQPDLGRLLRLDEIAADLGGGTTELGYADEIDAIVGELETRTPPDITDEDAVEALHVLQARDRLSDRATVLADQLRAGSPTPAAVVAFRSALGVYLGDALVGLAYALHMGDPSSLTYRQGRYAWLHRFAIAELQGGGREDLFDPWAATSENWILDVDESRWLHNSLFGVSEALRRWNFEDSIVSGSPPDPAAVEVWAATFAHLHVPSLTPRAQRVVAQRHARAGAWIREAVAARDPSKEPPPSTTVARPAEPPTLAGSLRRLMAPGELQTFMDAVAGGREDEALRLVSHGNRYLLIRTIEGNEVDASATARWDLDQMVGMTPSRRGDYLGLEAPAAIPYGEAGDRVADPLLYGRIFDARVRLAVLMEERGLPATLHPHLLMRAMAGTLSNTPPSDGRPWRGILAAVDTEITDDALNRWIIDLAFTDELTPADPRRARR